MLNIHAQNLKQVINTVQLSLGCEQQVSCQILSNVETIQGKGFLLSLNKGRGQSMIVKVKRKNEPVKPKITSEILQQVQMKCKMSMNGLDKLRFELQKVDKNFVERNIREKVRKKSHSLDVYFTSIYFCQI